MRLVAQFQSRPMVDISCGPKRVVKPQFLASTRSDTEGRTNLVRACSVGGIAY